MRHSYQHNTDSPTSFNPRTPGGVRPLPARQQNLRLPSFNPRTPGGVRRCHPRIAKKPFRFQSTHPGRGATKTSSGNQTAKLFQSTHPGRGATGAAGSEGNSIRSFNPRTPGGVRRLKTKKIRYFFGFNPRTPGGVRRSTHLAGRTLPSFNPRTPGGVRLCCCRLRVSVKEVSIHAPRAGCDRKTGQGRRTKPGFNPRTPGGVRPYYQISRDDESDVSIHAPRAGCDSVSTRCLMALSSFQSTHPGRGATQVID